MNATDNETPPEVGAYLMGGLILTVVILLFWCMESSTRVYEAPRRWLLWLAVVLVVNLAMVGRYFIEVWWS